MIERLAMVDGLLSSATVLLVALLWDHGWSRAAATAAVIALLRLGYWLYRWCCPATAAPATEDLVWLGQPSSGARRYGRGREVKG